MAVCVGDITGRRCGTRLFRCRHCGRVGCQREGCSNSNFKGIQCRSCSKYGKDAHH